MTREDLLNRFPYFKGLDFDHAFDNLTEVFTREVINNYILHLIENNKPFSLFIADVDNFKYVNDSFGHQTGDEVLKSVAKFLMDSIDVQGVVGRFGGDEFIIVCEGVVEYKEVWNVGHKINMTIGDLRFDNEDMPSITLSMGIARYPFDTKDYEELWSLADKALYRGKMKGRNCFIIYLEQKHKNLDLKGKRDLAFSPMYLHAKVFSTLTETKNLGMAIKNQLMFLSSYHMFDHVCIETPSGMKFRMVHSLSKQKEFMPLNYNELNGVVNNVGLAYVNKINAFGNSMSAEQMKQLHDQHIVSAVYCRINAYNKVYGYLRIDMTSTVRIWQTAELSLIVDTAKVIGLLLYFNNKTIEELDYDGVEIVGKE